MLALFVEWGVSKMFWINFHKTKPQSKTVRFNGLCLIYFRAMPQLGRRFLCNCEMIGLGFRAAPRLRTLLVEAPLPACISPMGAEVELASYRKILDGMLLVEAAALTAGKAMLMRASLRWGLF